MQEALLVHPALGATIDRGSPLQRASWLVPSNLRGPEHITSLGMTPRCIGTTSLGPCRQPLSHRDHMVPAASSHAAAPGAASHPASCHAPLLTQTCLLHVPKSARDSSAGQAAHGSCRVSSTKLGNPNRLPKPNLAMEAGGQDCVHLPCQNRNRAFRNGKGKGQTAAGRKTAGKRDTQPQQGSDMLREEPPISPAQG